MANPRPAPSDASRKLAVLILVWIAATWGLLFAPVKLAVSTTPVAGFLLLRFIYALCFLIPLVCWQRRQRPAVRRARSEVVAGWWYGLGAGVVLFLVYYLQTAGLAHTTSGKAGFITGLTVVFIPLVTAMVERERPGVAVFLSGLLAMAGLVWASMDTLQSGELVRIGAGDLLVLAAAFFNAIHIVANAKGAHRTSGPAFVTVQVCVSAALTWLLLPTGLAALLDYPLSVHLVAFGSGFYVIGLLLVIQTWAQRIVAPFTVGMIFNLEPLFAVAGGVLMLGEATSGQQMAGFAVMLAAILWAQYKDKPLAAHAAAS
ncbi:drug/metabolite transporter (DMT)-like permease [Janthinobacterium sp. CG_23.3]|uniref:DMT family transporter n=1 Tax=Janthinobacterium sp. CG_23.3 TaxID=3349634 RepID=UPI0038D44E7E